MKFLCDNCKAKYQIADEKLAGRAVRMKCRKCGHVIEVSAALLSGQPLATGTTTTSAISSIAMLNSSPPPPPQPRAPAPAPPAPRLALGGAPRPSMTSIPGDASVPVRKSLHGAGTKPGTSPGIKPPTAPSSKHQPVKTSPSDHPGPFPATHGSKAATQTRGVSDRPPAKAAAATLPSGGQSPGRAAGEPHASGLAAAFARSVKGKEADDESISAAIEVLSAGAGEEWYVGVNGVPLGPVRLATLRQKASQGVITPESLVWREGFDEWLPLRTFPELMVLLQEAATGRPSLMSSPPPAGQSMQRRGELSRPIPPASGRGAASPMFPPSASSGALVEDGSRTGILAAPFLAPSPTANAPSRDMGGGQSQPLAPRQGHQLPQDAVVQAAMAAASLGMADTAIADAKQDASRRSLVEDVAVGVRRQVRTHPAVYAFIAFAGLFGITAALALFSGRNAPAPPPTIQVVTVTAPPPPIAAPATPSAAPADSVIELTDRPTGGRRAASGASAGGSDKNDSKPAASSALPSVGIGIGAMPGLGPPVGGPKPGGGDNSSLPQLDRADIERVVAQQRALVKRQCWEPALHSREADAPKSAKVQISVTIAGDGNVQNASATGGTGYPGLSSCVASKVKSWKFPASSGPSSAAIPFAFFEQ